MRVLPADEGDKVIKDSRNRDAIPSPTRRSSTVTRAGLENRADGDEVCIAEMVRDEESAGAGKELQGAAPPCYRAPCRALRGNGPSNEDRREIPIF